MKTYTVHGRGEMAGPEGEPLVFAPEAFSWSAFLFAPIWFAVARAWAALVLWFVAAAAFVAFVYVAQPPIFETVGLALLAELFVGLEANHAWRAALERRGRRAHAIVAASHVDDAELAYFRRAPAPTAAEPRGAPPSHPILPTAVGGLFSEDGD